MQKHRLPVSKDPNSSIGLRRFYSQEVGVITLKLGIVTDTISHPGDQPCQPGAWPKLILHHEGYVHPGGIHSEKFALLNLAPRAIACVAYKLAVFPDQPEDALEHRLLFGEVFGASGHMAGHQDAFRHLAPITPYVAVVRHIGRIGVEETDLVKLVGLARVEEIDQPPHRQPSPLG